MTGLSRLAAPGYLVALFLISVPIVDTLVRVSPLQLVSVEWRYGTLGFLSMAVGVPFLGLLIAIMVASSFQHRVTLLALSLLAGLASLVLLGLGVVFVLAADAMRELLIPEMQRSFYLSALVVMSKYGAGGLLAGGFSWAGLGIRSRR